MIKTHSTLSKREAFNLKLLDENDWDSIAIDENIITINGTGIFDPTPKVLEIIFYMVKDKPQCNGLIKYMNNKGRLKRLYAEIGDEGKIKIMAAVLGNKDVDE